ncbi:MAG: Tryptophan synthase beta chain [candidate division TA06 bacterium ADurb.Bin131]|jgi:tryptophan synthase beta chain|uniref:Tryptophan synthase beta chain n=1 Tax=candidate division TA06 bacterium ADurb.Bin131 TaxID=1852827 RepID=A0A1V6CBT7_UNCT6|nr:MAG: Tryptophan synthase beta chain [candidate division TA06 bacterium ADurb.Bin131]HRV04186.1 tryptophan synthase subunit beta [Candidatus Ratteibacteria bacterium]
MKKVPDKKGRFGVYGGMFAPETLMAVIEQLQDAYLTIGKSREFRKELAYYFKYYVGRPTALYYASDFSRYIGCKVYLKREDLAFTGAHKINNTIGQVLLAKKMGKTRVIAETGAGQHGVATATAAALLKLQCEVYMGEIDMQRQALNVYRMRLLGAKVTCVKSGSRTLKDAINEAMRDWISSFSNTHYVIGTVVGFHPFPVMVRDFQSIIGKEAKRQIIKAEKKLPDFLVACVGGGSNSIGLFFPFFRDKSVRFIGVEAAGKGIDTDYHSATLCKGRPGILHGNFSYVLQDKNGQIHPTYSISAGLDYPGIGPEHSYYKDIGRAEYYAVDDRQVLNAFHILSESEGIIPALESAHAVAYLIENKKRFKQDDIIIVCLSGRGDKDVNEVARIEGIPL